MDPNNNRVEAERWLNISVKLLTARDFLGSKTFAIRARDSDPTNELPDQILAVVETVLAGEKRVNPSQHPDWYSVLQLPRLVRDPELIANHYRRLMVLLNPERNRLPFADYSLQRVMEAWSILSDPNKKWVFDNELAVYLNRLEQQQQLPPPQPQQVTAEMNTFQFFQPPQQQTMSMWPQPQPPPPPQQRQHFQNQQSQSHIDNSNNNNSSSSQLHQIEFMQPQPQPITHQQQHHHQQPQWQMRDPMVTKVGERNKGILNVMGSGGFELSGTPTNTGSAPVFRRVPDVVATPPMAAVLTPIPRAAAPPPPPQQQPPVVAPTVTVTARVMDGIDTVINNVVNNNDNGVNVVAGLAAAGVVNENVDSGVINSVVDDNNNANADGVNVEGNDEKIDEEVEKFWTSCPYCFYIYEYPKVYQDSTLRCQNCRRGFHAVLIPNPPLNVGQDGGDGGGDGVEKSKGSSFSSWGFFPLGFSTATWKKNNRMGKSGVASNWVPFSPMFAVPAENGGESFQWFENSGAAAIGPKYTGRIPASRPRIYVIDDEDGDFASDPSDTDSSDQDWRRQPGQEKKRKKTKRGNFRAVGRPSKVKTENVAVQSQEKKKSVGGRRWGEGSSTQQDVVIGLTATTTKVDARKKVEARKKVAATLTRNQAKRRVKNMGKLDLNVEFNNEGDEHAPTASAVNGEEDAIENIGFFEGLDEFFSTLPILNVGGEEKAKPA